MIAFAAANILVYIIPCMLTSNLLFDPNICLVELNTLMYADMFTCYAGIFETKQNTVSVDLSWNPVNVLGCLNVLLVIKGARMFQIEAWPNFMSKFKLPEHPIIWKAVCFYSEINHDVPLMNLTYPLSYFGVLYCALGSVCIIPVWQITLHNISLFQTLLYTTSSQIITVQEFGNSMFKPLHRKPLTALPANCNFSSCSEQAYQMAECSRYIWECQCVVTIWCFIFCCICCVCMQASRKRRRRRLSEGLFWGGNNSIRLKDRHEVLCACEQIQFWIGKFEWCVSVVSLIRPAHHVVFCQRCAWLILSDQQQSQSWKCTSRQLDLTIWS